MLSDSLFATSATGNARASRCPRNSPSSANGDSSDAPTKYLRSCRDSFFKNGSMPRERSALPRSVIFFPS